MPRSLLTLAIVLSGFVLHAEAVLAQGGRLSLGAGAGYGRVSTAETNRSLADVQYHARIGWRLSSALTLGLEMSDYASNDEDPRLTDLSFDSNGILVENRRPNVIHTRMLILSLQLGRPTGAYVRPGLGLGQHDFAVYSTEGSTQVMQIISDASRSSEGGPAFSVAMGNQTRVSTAVRVGVELIGAWSGGEDSSSARRIIGLQLIPVLSF